MSAAFSTVTTALVVATALGAVVGLGIAMVAWRRRERPAAKPFILFVCSQSGWSLAAVGLWLSPSFQVAVGFRLLTWVMATASLLTWLYFTLEYTGRTDEFRGWPRRLVLGWAGLTILDTLISPWTGLSRGNFEPAAFEGLTLVSFDFGPLFPVQLLVTYGLILFSYWVMFRFYRKAHPGQRTQAGLILLADLLFAVATFAYYAGGLSLHPFLDPSPLFFSITVVVVAYALLYYDFLQVTPLAMDLLLEEMDDPIVVVDEDGVVVDQNDPAADIGAAPGAALADTVPTLAEALAEGEQTVTLATSADEQRIFDLNVSPVSDHHDQRRGQLLVLRDVTVLKRRERELNEKNEELEEFAHVVSHDLRNPLNVAHGFATEARESGDMETLDRSIAAMEDMEQLIDDLLTLAREGRTVAETEPVAFEAVAESAWPFVGDGPTLVVESDGTVEADEHRLAELLGNCFRNAGEHGGEAVTVWTGITEDGFYVEDDGPGVPKTERDRVFESGVTASESGSGLGLAIVANIAEAHGWSVTVEDGREGGARFIFEGAEVEAPAEAADD